MFCFIFGARSVIWTSTAIANRKKVAILITFLFPGFRQLWSSAEGGARRTWRGTVSGVGLGSMVWRRYGAVGRYAHGAMERHRCSVVNRHGTAWWDDTYPASWSGRVQWCGKARARRCGVVQVWCLERTRRCAMEWRGFGAVGCARCDVIGKCGVRWRRFFGFAAKMGKLQKVSKTS